MGELLPFSQCLHSLLSTSYFCSARKERFFVPGMPCLCDRTVSIPQSEAPISVTNGILESGCLRMGAVVNLVLSAVFASPVHCKFVLFVLYILFNYQFAKSRNLCNSLIVCAWGITGRDIHGLLIHRNFNRSGVHRNNQWLFGWWLQTLWETGREAGEAPSQNVSCGPG